MYLTDADVAYIRRKSRGRKAVPSPRRKSTPRTIPAAQWLTDGVGQNLGYGGKRYTGSVHSIVVPSSGYEDALGGARLRYAHENGGIEIFETDLEVLSVPSRCHAGSGGNQTERHVQLKYSIGQRVRQSGNFKIEYEYPVSYGKADVYVPNLKLCGEAGLCAAERVLSAIYSGDPVVLAPYGCDPQKLYLFVRGPEGERLAEYWIAKDEEHMREVLCKMHQAFAHETAKHGTHGGHAGGAR